LGDLGVAGTAGIGREQHLSVRGATGEERGGEQGAEDIEAFTVGDEGTEALAGMADAIAGKAEHHTDHGDIGKMFQWGEGGEAWGFDVKGGEVGGGAGEDDGTSGESKGVAAGGTFEGPVVVGEAGEFLDAGIQGQVGSEALGEGIGEDLQAVVEGELGGIGFGDFPALTAFAGAEELSADEGAIAVLEMVDAGEGMAEGEGGRVPGIDTVDHGVDAVVEEFLAEAASDELGDTFLVGMAAGTEGFGEEVKFGSEGEEGGKEEGGRGTGQGDGASVTDHIACVGGGVGIPAALGQAEVGEELGNGWGGIEDGIGTAFGQPGAVAMAGDDTAGAGMGFKHEDMKSALLQGEGGAQAADAGADDSDIGGGGGRRGRGSGGGFGWG
jgi:hypothetical protein